MELLFDRKGGASDNLSAAAGGFLCKGLHMAAHPASKEHCSDITSFIEQVQLDGRVFVAM